MEESLNHSDVIDLREQQLSPESVASTHNSTEHNIEDFDSEDVGDVTPIQDVSTDTSTAFETSTVVENTPTTAKLPTLKPQIPPKPTFLLGDRKINVTEIQVQTPSVDTVSTVSDVTASAEEDDQSDDDNEEDIIDVSGEDFIIVRNRSGELSTVSEVSEEISTNGKSYKSDSGSASKNAKVHIQNSSSENGEPLSESGSIADSTTSGSFMIDGNLTEPNSLSEAIERPTIEKSGSFPSIMTDHIDKSFPIDTEITIVNETDDKDLSGKQNGQIEQINEDTDQVTSEVTESKSTDSSGSSAQKLNVESDSNEMVKEQDVGHVGHVGQQICCQQQTITVDVEIPIMEVKPLTFKQITVNNKNSEGNIAILINNVSNNEE